jgi:hypothetical protein
MTRRSSFGTASFPIRRGFDPSRSQLRTLAFAFEQALPLVRKDVINSTDLQAIEASALHLNIRSVATGARS